MFSSPLVVGSSFEARRSVTDEHSALLRGQYRRMNPYFSATAGRKWPAAPAKVDLVWIDAWSGGS